MLHKPALLQIPRRRFAAHEAPSRAAAAGDFGPCRLRRLVKLLCIQDDALQEAQVQDLARENRVDMPHATFLANLRRSFMLCRRGALLYPRETELAISFNGGKDASAMLYLWLAAVVASAPGAGSSVGEENGRAEANGAKNTAEAMSIGQQTVIYFDSPDEFPEVRSFVKRVVDSLGLRMVRVEQQSFREGLGDMVKDGLQAVVMGQRRGDPWTEKMDEFSPSTDGWPPFMRINPIIDWSFADVWTFLRVFELPYCEMYDRGYTSLGSVRNTQKNPALRRPDGSFAPAYKLCDGSQERAGRSKASPRSGSAPAKAVDASSETTRSCSSTASPRTAGIVIVGSELLSGKAKDENSHYLCCELRNRGVMVTCIEVVPDDVEGSQCCASSRLWLDAHEEDVAGALHRIVDEFPLVEVDSHPTAGTASKRGLLSITFEAFDAEQLEAAKRRFAGLLSVADRVVPEPAAECVQVTALNQTPQDESTITIQEGETASKRKRARTCADGGPTVATS